MSSSVCKAASSYRGPLIVIGLGIGFVAVGSIPVAVTFCRGNRSSATIIGVGFIGFGLLLVMPGLLWCLVRRITTFRCCTRRKRLRSIEVQEKTPSIQNIPSSPGGRLAVASVESEFKAKELMSPKRLEEQCFDQDNVDVEEAELDERDYDDDDQDQGPVLLKR